MSSPPASYVAHITKPGDTAQHNLQPQVEDLEEIGRMWNDLSPSEKNKWTTKDASKVLRAPKHHKKDVSDALAAVAEQLMQECQPSASAQPTARSVPERLAHAKTLMDTGVITQAEYELARTGIIASL